MRSLKVPVTYIARIDNPTAAAAAQACGPVSFNTAKPTSADNTCPPIRARGCAGSTPGEPITSTMDVANGMTASG